MEEKKKSIVYLGKPVGVNVQQGAMLRNSDFR